MKRQLAGAGADGAPLLLGDGQELEASSEKTGAVSLPLGRGADAALAAAVSSAGPGGRSLAAAAGNTARAVSFSEHLGQGAISQAGALPMSSDRGGGEGWVQLAEGKLRRDNELSHTSLMWELGAEMLQKKQRAEGGLNVTHEGLLLANLTTWLQAHGGALSLATPALSRAKGLLLEAAEPLQEGDAVLHVPFKALMCRQTARNVLVGQRSGRYLGEELSKAFEQSEVWVSAGGVCGRRVSVLTLYIYVSI